MNRFIQSDALRNGRAARRAFLLAAFFLSGLAASPLLAQPANDNFANAQVLAGGWGSVTNDNAGATAEPGEPPHAGQPAAGSIWYSWIAPSDGEVTLDSYGSLGIDPSNPNLDARLAVYTGTNVTRLRQVAANDNIFPLPFQANLDYSLGAIAFDPPVAFFQQFNQLLPGPSVLKFNAKAGTKYYFCADSFSPGIVVVNWAFHSSGVFRFASEQTLFDGVTFTPVPAYLVAETDGLEGRQSESTVFSYFHFSEPGAVVTVTRVGGSSGRILVDYATADISAPPLGWPDTVAVGGIDYFPIQGTLAFDDYEMTKQLVIPLFGTPFPDSNRVFSVVLSNPRRAPNESPDVSDPRIDPTMGMALVKILDVNIDPGFNGNFDTNMPPKFVPATNAVFNFGVSHYCVPEDIQEFYTNVVIWVWRDGTNNTAVTLNYEVDNYPDWQEVNELNNNFFALQPGSDYATGNPEHSNFIYGTNTDFNLTHGTIQFPENIDFVPITLDITNDTLVEFNEDFIISLYRVVDNSRVMVGTVNQARITILYDDQDAPAGSVDENFNADYGAFMKPPVITTPQQVPHPGTDGVVYSLLAQPDGNTVLAGNFLSYNNSSRNCIVRVLQNGALDGSFTPGNGANDFVSSVLLTTTGQYYISGGFSSYNGLPANRVARLTANGVLDGGFDAGLGPDGAVWASVLQPDGKLLIAGEFTSVNNTPRLHVARLNQNGTLDSTFDPGTNGPNGTVWTMLLTPTGRILIGGEFTTIGGLPQRSLARLNANGSLDTTYAVGVGTDGIVYSMALQPNGKLWIGGEFTTAQLIPALRFARLNATGALDTTFDPGTSADSTIYSIAGNADGSVYIGGSFTSFNGTHRLGFSRLYADGTVDTTFMDTAYNQFAGLHKRRFSDPPGTVFSSSVQPSGDVMIAGLFEQVGGGQAEAIIRGDPTDPPGAYNQDVWMQPKARDGVRNRSNFARLLGGSTTGPGNIGLVASSYGGSESQNFISVGLSRENGALGYGAVNFSVQDGFAQAGQDYTYYSGEPVLLSTWLLDLYGPLGSVPNARTRMHSDGLYGLNTTPTDVFQHQWFNYTNALVNVNFVNDNIIQGNRDTTFSLANPVTDSQFYLGGANIPLGIALGRSRAPFSIIDDDHNFGVLGFAQPEFAVNESSNTVTITITRTNGSVGTVSVAYLTTNGTATAGLDYFSTSGSLSFGNGQTTKSFTVPIINDSEAEDDETFVVRLYNPGNGATLGLSNAVVTILDNDSPNGRVNFSSSSFATNENSGVAYITVRRGGGSQGTLGVTVATGDGTAQTGVDYFGFTNTINWGPGDTTPQVLPIPLINNATVQGNRTVLLRLRGTTVNGFTNTASLGSISNAFLTILEDDAYGTLGFNQATYFVNENGGPATVTVTRSSGIAQAVTVNFATSGGTNVSTADYTPTNGLLVFGPGEISKTFDVQILNNQFTDLPRTINLILSNANPGASLGSPSFATITIRDDEALNEPAGSPDTAFLASPGFNGDVYALALQPNGGIVAVGDFTVVNNVPLNRVARLNANGTLDVSLYGLSGGANAAVRALAQQSDGKLVIGGFFTNLNGVTTPRIGRLQGNGSIDTSFNVGVGADNIVYAVSEVFAGGARKILVGGAFLNVGIASRPGLARLNDNGTVDFGFVTGGGANGAVYAIAPYPTNSVRAGQFLIAGDFTIYNSLPRSHIARINADGSLDQTFDPLGGPNDSVRAVAIQADEQILIGGLFTNLNGTPISHFARLTASGAVDPTFQVGVGANDIVSGIALQPDGKILMSGYYITASGVTRHRITRLKTDGTVDPTINFGLGADAFASTVLLQPDAKILLAGGFKNFDGDPHVGIVRLYGGAMNGSGTFEFTSANYQVDENGTNALISVRRRGGTSGAPVGNVEVTMTATNGTAIGGVNFIPTTNVLSYPPGEVVQTVSISVTQDFAITADLTVNLALRDPQPAGNPSQGFPAVSGQITSILTLLNDDSGVSFGSAVAAINENTVGGLAYIPILRTGSGRLTSTVQFLTTTNGTALANINYTPVTNLVTFLPTEMSNSVALPILYDTSAQGDRTVVMRLTNANNSLLLAPAFSTLNIVDVEHLPGQFRFGQTNYTVNEGDGSLVVNIVRTNGRSGIASVSFATLPGTAVPGQKYINTNGVLTFADGETNKSFSVLVLDNASVEGNQTFSMILTNATGGASILGSTNVQATIVDNDIGVGFLSPAFVAPETAGAATLTLVRQNGSNIVTRVNYVTTNVFITTTNGGVITTNLGGIAGTNYVAVTNSITFANNETIKSFQVQVLHDPRVTGDMPFGVNLFAPTNLSNPSLPVQLLPPSSAVVTVLDTESGFAFTNSAFFTAKSATNVLVTVVRSNANTGIVQVNYATVANGSAVAGVDFVSTSGNLTFSNGITYQSFSVPIINNQLVPASNLTFAVILTNPSPTSIAQVVPPGLATITITNDLSGLSFSAPSYTINENGGAAVVNVFRTGYLNSTVSVAFSTGNGTGLAGVNYVPTNGVVVFTNGETVKTFTITVIDNGIVDGDKTVLLNLAGPVGNAVLVNPSAGTLNIIDIDGTSVVASGSSLSGESGPVNGVIDSNETVTVLFALRAAGGTNTANLVATLLATNGVSNPSGPQNYGALVVHGASAFRPFSFKAVGTNGQTITAVFRLQDGASSLSNAVFSFVLGDLPVVFANPNQIVINDFTNATPYPSTINVVGLPGAIVKTTVQITNLNHTAPADVSMLLVSPGGQKTYLMSKAGGNNALSRVTLTFDDAFPPLSTGPIVTGTNRPTAFPVAPPPFPVPAPPPAYTTNLSVFTGGNPNGNWSLFVYDDTHLDFGIISNGWSLSFNSAAPSAADLGVAVTANASSVVLSSNVTFTLYVTNYGPAMATALTLTDILPVGSAYVSSAPSAGTVTTNGAGILTWNIPSLGTNSWARNQLIVQANTPGLMTNLLTSSAATTDANGDNNAALAVVNAIAPAADLTLFMISSPNPTVLGGIITYAVSVTNAGPATALSLGLTNTLSPGVSFLYAQPSNAYTLGAGKVTFANLGSLGSGSATNVSIVVQANASGTLTNTATAGSLVFDPLKAGNTVSVKTEVQAVQLTFARSGNNLVISWPVSPMTYNLETATNLGPPAVWTLAAPAPPPVGGMMTVVVPISTTGNRFYRLRGVGP